MSTQDSFQNVPLNLPFQAFLALDPELPLALFPVRLEARFLPDRDPTEIVVRVFPDEIHLNTHNHQLTPTEQALATTYWDTVWRAAAEPAATTEARLWLAEQLGAHRAAYVAAVTQPEGDPPAEPTEPGEPLRPPIELTAVDVHDHHGPGQAQLLPLHWAAYVDFRATTEWETNGPFWAAQPVDPNLVLTPALTNLGQGAGAREFLDAQGLGWTHNIDKAETAGMVIRIPLADLPRSPDTGDVGRIYVLGVRSGANGHRDVADALAAHRHTRGLELLMPGTATNATEADPPAEQPAIDAMFEAALGETLRPTTTPIEQAAHLLTAAPADALNIALGHEGSTAIDRSIDADDLHPSLARAANQVLWPATLARWFSDPMRWANDGSPLLPGLELDAARQWFVDYVRSEGPLPNIRVGDQPYGVLPTMLFGNHNPPANGIEELEDFVTDLFDYWFDSASMGERPVLDPDSTDRPPDGMANEKASEVGAVLGATPHLHELRLRPVDDLHEELRDLYLVRIGFAKLLAALVPAGHVNDANGELDHYVYATPDELDDHPWYAEFVNREADLEGASGLYAQQSTLADLLVALDGLSGYWYQEEATTAIIDYLDPDFYSEGDPVTADVAAMLQRHHDRVEPFGTPNHRLAALGAEDALGRDQTPRLSSAGYGEEGSEESVTVLVAAKHDEEHAVALVDWLEGVRLDLAEFQTTGDRPTYDRTESQPLFHHLIHSAVATIEQTKVGMLRAGLGTLRDRLDDRGPSAIAEVERLTRATLGLASYRLDAWITSLATERLASLRVGRPTGLQVGGYGWLVDVKPRKGPATQGHIHAPSLDHATTAAVLRSGWSAFGTDDEGGPLTVDLSSDRIRAARSLIEGVQSGQELGRLLGARFERRLHDGRRDHHIDDVRRAVLAGSGEARRVPARTVDGLLLARAYTDGIERTPAETAVRDSVDGFLAGIDDDEQVLAAIDATATDLDAVADILFSQSVHALLRGDHGVAAPTLAATGSGDSGLPAIDFPASRLGGTNLTVRVIAFLDDLTPAPGWPVETESLAALAEPRLEPWVGHLLGEPGDVIIDVVDGERSERITLANLGLAAIDVVYELDALAGRAIGHVGGSETASIVAGRPPDLEDHQLAFDELVTLVGVVRDALAAIRPLRATDIMELAGGDPGADEDEEALAELDKRFDVVADLVPSDDPKWEALDRHLKEHPQHTIAAVTERIQILVGSPVPIFPIVTSGVPDPIGVSFADRDGETRLRPWLAQAAKVNPGLQAVLSVVELAELLHDRPLIQPEAAQAPDLGGDWIGSGPPSSTAAHVAWCSLTGPPPAGPIAGFVADAWSEVIPTSEAATGIAVHFDRPSAQAPNAVLLALARPGENFAVENVMACLRSTLSCAQLRTLGADEAWGVGQYLPAVFFDDDIAVENAEEPS